MSYLKKAKKNCWIRSDNINGVKQIKKKEADEKIDRVILNCPQLLNKSL